MQHEEMLATIVPDIKDTGFNTVALFFMLFLFVIFFFYFGFELILLPLLSSIDDALVHIYNLGRYGIVITVFLLTYKMFTTSNIGPNQRLICSDTLRYWRFLQTGCLQNVNIFASLHNAINCLINTVEAI